MTVPMTRASTVAQNAQPQGDQHPLENQAGHPAAALLIEAQQVLGDGLPVPFVLGLDGGLVEQPGHGGPDPGQQDQVRYGDSGLFSDHWICDSQSLVSNQ
jgi:hypothetical protein